MTGKRGTVADGAGRYTAGMPLLFQLVQTLYWLALATWFGGALFLAMSAPTVFRVVSDARPLLPGVLSVNLDNQHSTLLAGAIVSRLLANLHRVQLVAIVVLALTIAGQWLLSRPGGADLVLGILRTCLFVAAVVVALYDWRVLWPKVLSARDRYVENADNPDIANPALDEFNRLQRDAAAMLRNLLFLLLGMILFSGTIRFGATLVLE